jgi:hypothetical protein
MAIAVGERVPDFEIIRAFQDVRKSSEMWKDGPTAFHFYAFAFTGNPEAG